MSHQNYSSSLLPPLLWLILILFSLSAEAATFTVTNLNDSGPGSLRQAMLEADAATGDDTIVFQSGLSGTITLTSGPLTINSNIAIYGPGANVLAVSGNNVSQVFVVGNCIGPTASIDGLTIKDGNSTYSGGGIFNGGGTLTISNSTVSGNSSHDMLSGGGGIAISTILCERPEISSGKLTVINSTLSGNSAFSQPGSYYGSTGGGILIGYRSTATIINSTLSGNSTGGAGGAVISWGTLTISNSTISGNWSTSQYGGGGILNSQGGTLTLSNSIVAGNIAPTGKEIFNVTWPGPGVGGGIFISQGHNLFGENGASGVEGATLNSSDIVLSGPINTAIAPLGNYGGPTQTHALQPNSVAINAIPVKPVDYCRLVTGEPLTTDQRGVKRPQGSACDMGAFEYNSSPFSAFNVKWLVIDQNRGSLFLFSSLTLGNGSNGIGPAKEEVTLKIADSTMTIPAGSFQKNRHWPLFASAGQIDNIWIEAIMTPLGKNRFKFQALAYGVQLGDTKNPIAVELTIGDDGGTTTANALPTETAGHRCPLCAASCAAACEDTGFWPVTLENTKSPRG